MQESVWQLERLIVALPCIFICAITAVLIVLRMIGAELSIWQGFGALGLLIGTMWFCVNPPHPLFPPLAAVGIVALLATFPFAERELMRRELRDMDKDRLERAFYALMAKPDNVSAMFDVARLLHEHGFKADAIVIAEGALSTLSKEREAVKNASMRDLFLKEESLLARWKREPLPTANPKAQLCPACKTSNAVGALYCSGCKRPYLLDKVKLAGIKEKVFAKLLLAYMIIAGLILGGGAIGLTLEGNARYAALAGALILVGVILGFLFRLQKPATV